ncbi:hypothetical protein [Aquamicrobium sp.]|nr:hypothetical protein [Aquamicrobium sp.]
MRTIRELQRHEHPRRVDAGSEAGSEKAAGKGHAKPVALAR